jgi:2-deoxy-D-gluconate 3-dehydrogenase
MSFSLAGKTAVVFGGTGGLGRAVCLTLADHGADVAPVSRSVEKVAAVAREIESFGVRSAVESADACKPEAVEAVRDRILEKFGKIDVLVNCQGVSIRDCVLTYPYETWRDLMTLNLDSVFLTTKAFGNVMAAQKSGKIINLASMMALFGSKTGSAYSASKGAIVQFTKSTALDLASYNIQVNSIAPGWFETELTRKVRTTPELNRRVVERIPSGNWGRAESVGACVVFLASAAADYITGAVIPVDGGFSCNSGV